MIQTRIVNYDRLEQSTFDEQINEVLKQIQEVNKFIKIIDIKVMNEKRVMILYKDID
ncbi:MULTISPECIES: hypothetical protein [Staphylococcus]|uniref:hypothetical protein n=1 Tax=Staphylococcus TaxID=1279 RepID=UPI000AE84D47|nr:MULTISPECIES: hypothetical protein [Staphylococcus]MCE5030047.1 hypothetical protein [Staphylococcus epidermidis]MCE5032353.1 hypothetical protein [Staphylococcus epidermidis]